MLLAYREIFPPNLPALPPFWSEIFRVGAPDIFAMMHDVHAIVAHGALWDENRRLSILATPAWESGVLVCISAVDRHYGVEAERFIVAMLQILTALELRECDVRGILIGAKVRYDGVAQLLIESGITGKAKKHYQFSQSEFPDSNMVTVVQHSSRGYI
jgi:hypothetical protein